MFSIYNVAEEMSIERLPKHIDVIVSKAPAEVQPSPTPSFLPSRSPFGKHSCLFTHHLDESNLLETGMSKTVVMSLPPQRLVALAVRPLARPRSPRSYLRICRTCRARLSSIATTPTQRSQPASSRPGLQAQKPVSIPSKAHFSTTPPQSATIVLQNPRVDEEGNEMTITISSKAARRLRQITSTPARKNTLVSANSPSPDAHLRVTVTSGGCHGFQYLMSLEDASKVDGEEDTVFEYSPSGDDASGETASSKGKAEVVMDSASLELLKGSTIDFTEELIGSQFKVVGNPRATSSCGCGTSFDIE
jgi:iron-sulfur cluster assembly 2